MPKSALIYSTQRSIDPMWTKGLTEVLMVLQFVAAPLGPVCTVKFTDHRLVNFMSQSNPDPNPLTVISHQNTKRAECAAKPRPAANAQRTVL